MADLIGSINQAMGHVARGTINTIDYSTQAISKGIIYVGEGPSRCLYDVYDLSREGFEKWTKAVLSTLKLSTRLFQLDGLFAGVIATLEAQRDLYYATKFIGSLSNFIDAQTLTFKIPKNDGKLDLVIKLCYITADVLDPFKALQKYKIVSFENCTKIATQLGNYRVSFLGDRRFEDIPIVGSLCDKPKEFFVFTASVLELFRTLVVNPYYAADAAQRWEPLKQLDTQLKLVGSIGKIYLISMSRSSYNTLPFALVDFATQSAGLAKLLMTLSKERAKRFERPQLPVAAAIPVALAAPVILTTVVVDPTTAVPATSTPHVVPAAR